MDKSQQTSPGGLNLPSAETLYVVTPNHKIILLLLHYCNFSAARNCNIRYIWYAGYLMCGPVKRSFEPPRGGNPQVENPYIRCKLHGTAEKDHEQDGWLPHTYTTKYLVK